MELSLSRTDLLQTGCSTARYTMKLLPGGPTMQQRVVVGDDTGVVQSFGMRKGDVVSEFKTLPTGQQILHVTLGLSLEQADKIFVSSAQTVRGFNRKGKDFYRFQTNLTEEIRVLRVADLSVWTAGDYAVNHFVNNVEAAFMMTKDRVNDMEVVAVTRERERNIVLACQDQLIRMMEGASTYYEAAVDGVPTALQCRGLANGEAEMLFGTQAGLLGQIYMNKDHIRRGWVARTKRTGAVQAMETCFDFNRDGRRGILLGRDDGSLEVYGLDEHGEAMLLYQKGLGESINAVQCGAVVSPHAEDCIVETYSGKIVAFENRADGGGEAVGGGAAAGEVKETAMKRLRALQADLESLKAKVDAERRAFAAAEDSVIQPTTNRINDKLVLDAGGSEGGTHLLVLETPMPISVVALQSDVPVDLPEQGGAVAIMSRLPADSDNAMRAVFRCQDAVNRLQIHLRLSEGAGGTLTAFVIPRMAPKSGTVLTYRFKPLCLHTRTQPNAEDEKRPLSELRITGGFSLLEIHTWVGGCLPEVATRPPVEDAVTLRYRSVLLGTLLEARYRAGECRFLSDSVSALSLLREAVTLQATARKARVNLAFEPKPEALSHLMRLVHPLLEYQHSLSQKVQLLEGLRELRGADGDSAVGALGADFAAILADGDRLERDARLAPRRLESLRGVVRDLYVDWHRFKGSNVRSRLSALDALLRNYEREAVLHFLETQG